MSAVKAGDRAQLKVAIIGAGEVGEKHALAFRRLSPETCLIGVADVDAARAASLAAKCETQPFTGYQALLDLEPDVAIVGVPHYLHREVAQAAAERGIHLLMEKPLAHTLEDAYAIVDVARTHQVALAVGFVHRFRLEFQQAHRAIAEGKLGTPAIALDTFCTGGGTRVPAWVWRKQQAGGGALMYTGIHSVDRLRWLLDSEVVEVFARAKTYTQAADVEDGLVATLVFDNGCVATLIENAPDYEVVTRSWDCEIYGSLGRLRMRTGAYVEFTGDAGAYQVTVQKDDCFYAQARGVAAAIQAGRTPWITGEDGLRAQEVVESIYRSAASGQVDRPQYPTQPTTEPTLHNSR
jgi:predicted dehydrogenase